MAINAAAKTEDHTFLFDRSRGTYKDVGPTTKLERVLKHFSCGTVRIAPVAVKNNSGPGTAGQADGYDKK